MVEGKKSLYIHVSWWPENEALTPRFHGSKKHNLPTGIPAVKVIHDHSCNKHLPQVSQEADKNILEESILDNVELIVSNN